MNIDYNAVIEILKKFLDNEKIEILGISVGEERQVREAIKNLLTAYEKEKEKNKELSNSYDKLAKECNEENRRCMLLAVENQDLKEKNKKIDEFCRKELAFERRLKREDREPDEFNQGRFYVSENIRKIIEEE